MRLPEAYSSTPLTEIPKNIKSGDLVTLLNENGFEVKGANSNIEDEAIGFLMNYFKKKKAAAKAEPKEEVKAPVKEEPKVEKKEEPKVEKKVEEKKFVTIEG